MDIILIWIWHDMTTKSVPVFAALRCWRFLASPGCPALGAGTELADGIRKRILVSLAGSVMDNIVRTTSRDNESDSLDPSKAFVKLSALCPCALSQVSTLS